MKMLRNLAALLNRPQRRAALVLLALMLVGMVLEIFGIGLVVPALVVVSSNDIYASHAAILPLLAALGHPSQTELVIGGMLAMVVAYAVKSAFLVFLTSRQFAFVFELQEAISLKLFTGYLRQPYSFHLRRNSAELVRNVVNETRLFGFYLLIPSLFLIAEALIVVGVLGLLFTIEPLGALAVVVCVGGAGASFIYLTRTRILAWGETRQFHEGARQLHLQQGLDASKDVKLLGREAEFIALFAQHNHGVAEMERKQNIYQALPRLWLEFIAIVGLTVLVAIIVARGGTVAAIIPTIGVFAAAAFRLIPSANRVLSSAQYVRYALPVINTLHGELALFEKAPAQLAAAPFPLRQDIRLTNLSFTYAESTRTSLTGVNLVIQRGSSVGFIGGSGAGKSTLVDVILGLLTPTEGAVLVDGQDIQANLRGWQDQLGYVPQNIYLTDDTIRRNVAFGIAAQQIDEQAVQRAIKTAQLEEFVLGLPGGLETHLGERGVRLSGGQRQRIGIARALYHNPAVLVLDEATSALDVATERGVMEAVNALQGQKTILIVAHRLSTVAECDVLYRLEGGNLAAENLELG